MKYLFLLASLFFSSLAVSSEAKICFVKHPEMDKYFSGLGVYPRAVSEAMLDCHSWAKRQDQEPKDCKLNRCFDYQPKKSEK